MKKWMALPVLAIAMSSLLSGCGVILVIIDGLTVSEPAVTSQWTSAETGKPVICDNLDTQLSFSFNYNGTITGWDATLIGRNNTSLVLATGVTKTTPGVTSGTTRISTTVTVGPQTVPQNVGTQSISTQSVVVDPPAPPAPKSITLDKNPVNLRITVYNGQNSGYLYYYDIPVGTCN